MIGRSWRLVALAVGLAAALPAAAQSSCQAPQWQRVSEATLGVAVDVSAPTITSYAIDSGNFVNTEVRERGRDGAKVEGRCSSFNFSVTNFGDSEISDAAGLLKYQADTIASADGLKNFKLVRNRALTFQGLPAREVIFSFTIDFFGTPASHRYLLVARGQRLYAFNWVWSDAGPVPSDATRITESIRFIPATVDPNARSRAMLEETILLYWLRRDYPSKVYLSPALRKIADPKRAAESRMVDGYGYVQKVDFLRTENGYRVFRVEHNNAVVDWWTSDDGRQIDALTWKKVRDLAR
jgi:hypothetical protein